MQGRGGSRRQPQAGRERGGQDGWGPTPAPCPTPPRRIQGPNQCIRELKQLQMGQEGAGEARQARALGGCRGAALAPRRRRRRRRAAPAGTPADAQGPSLALPSPWWGCPPHVRAFTQRHGLHLGRPGWGIPAGVEGRKHMPRRPHPLRRPGSPAIPFYFCFSQHHCTPNCRGNNPEQIQQPIQGGRAPTNRPAWPKVAHDGGGGGRSKGGACPSPARVMADCDFGCYNCIQQIQEKLRSKGFELEGPALRPPSCLATTGQPQGGAQGGAFAGAASCGSF